MSGGRGGEGGIERERERERERENKGSYSAEMLHPGPGVSVLRWLPVEGQNAVNLCSSIR